MAFFEPQTPRLFGQMERVELSCIRRGTLYTFWTLCKLLYVTICCNVYSYLLSFLGRHTCCNTHMTLQGEGTRITPIVGKA